jgi:hypothetical protein
MAKTTRQATGRTRIGESEIKSLDGLSFGSRDTLPQRVQTIDPARIEAGKQLATRAIAGEYASDGRTYPTHHAAHLAGMNYRRLLVLGITRLQVHTHKPNLRVTQTPDGFTWSVYASAAKAAKADKA